MGRDARDVAVGHLLDAPAAAGGGRKIGGRAAYLPHGMLGLDCRAGCRNGVTILRGARARLMLRGYLNNLVGEAS